MKRALIASLVVAAAVAIMPAVASADTYSFSNTSQITIPPAGSTGSTISVRGVRGPVADVQVGLIGVTHGRPQDLDVLLLPPDRHGAILMSDVCGTEAVSNYLWVFQSSGNFLLPSMGDTCPGTFYRATNLDTGPDSWPGVGAAETGYSMPDWNRKAMNGDWKLLVVDDQYPYGGTINNGWTLQFTTRSVDTFVPGAGTSGVADRYPAAQTVDGPSGEVIRNVQVVLPGIAHDRASDLNLLLEGPQGQNVMLMSGACSGTSVERPFMILDENAPAPLPQEAPQAGCPFWGSPANYRPLAVMPAPAPRGPYGPSLAAFDGTSPNGQWKLYASDSGDGGDGYIAERFTLQFDTRPRANVDFTRGAITLPEGGTQAVTITRSANGTLGPADVTLTTTAASATAGADFTPLSQTVHFDRGESEKTVTLDAVDDSAAEPDETYTVKLSDPTGDAQLGRQTQVDVTIPASAGKPDSGLHPTPAPRCGGKPATIVGTAGKDVLRGTRGADVIAGLGGNDTVTAVKGNDTVCGGAGNDTIAGGAGRDRLSGGPGNDRLTGGAGRDTCLGGRGRNRVSCERKAAR